MGDSQGKGRDSGVKRQATGGLGGTSAQNARASVTSYQGVETEEQRKKRLAAEDAAKQTPLSADEVARKKAEADAEYKRLLEEQAKKGKKLSPLDIAMGRR